MRALVDANVFISYLLAPDSSTPPVLLTDAAIIGAYRLLLTEGVISEVVHKSATKPYLTRRIDSSQTARLVAVLRAIAEWIPELDPPHPEIGHDRKDDYLFAHAVYGAADFLISGDGGVRGIDRIGDVRIVTPAEFVAILSSDATR